MRPILVGLVTACLVVACSEEGGFKYKEFYESVQQCAETFAFSSEGEWMEDFDDAAFYGVAFYAQAGKTDDNDGHRQWARESAARNLSIIREADMVTGDVNLIAMAALGYIEYIDASGDRSGLEDLDKLIRDINTMVAAMGHYVPPAMVSGYAMETYGPVAINGLMGLISLQRAFVLGKDDTTDMIEFTEQVAAQLKERHFNGTNYDFSAEREGLFLYPNITMIILNARLHQLTGKAAYKDHALAVYQGIQALKVTTAGGLAGPGRYRSPYSAEHMGAQTDDYTTLSSQNYTMLALMLLYQITADEKYLSEIDPIVEFLRDHLSGDACSSDLIFYECDPVCEGEQTCLKGRCFDDACHCGVLHHWIDGRLALATDNEYFCSGCNHQMLYILWYRQYRAEIQP